MAVIGKIRERSTLVLIIIGGAIMAFVLSDLFSSGQGGRQQGPVNLAEVNGTTVNPQEFEIKVQKAYENYQAQTEEELDERTKSTIREQVWTEMLSDILLGNQMQELGIEVTSKELFDMVQGNNPHPQVKQAFTNPETGEFNSSAVVNFLQNLDNDPKVKEQWIEFERALKRNQRIDKYYTLVKKGLYVPSNLAEKEFLSNKTSVNFKYVYRSYASVSDSLVQLSEGDIKDYYNAHKSDYEQKASRKISYAYFPINPSIEDVNQANQWANETFTKFQKAENDSLFVNANSDNRFDPIYYSINTAPTNSDTSLWNNDTGYVTQPKLNNNTYTIQKIKAKKIAPDSVLARHILINTQTQEENVAEKLADSLLEMLENGANFEELAVQFSDDQATSDKGGEFGWLTEGKMIKALNDALFTTETGTYEKIKSRVGFHIIEILERTEPIEKIQIATVSREITPSKETYAELFNQANSFSIDATDMESFDAAITEKNITKRSATLSESDNAIQGLTAARDLARWVKEANEGDISEAYDTDAAFIVAIVESVNLEGAAPLEKVRNRVEFLARQEKKAALMKEEMAGTTDLSELASKQGLSIETAENVTFSSPALPNIGLEPNVVGKAMSLEKGQMSVPIQGNSGVFVIAIESKSVPPEANIAQARANSIQGMNSIIESGAVFNALKEKADLTDNRSKFY